MAEGNKLRNIQRSKIKKIEQDLESEFYRVCDEKGIEVPSVPKIDPEMINKIKDKGKLIMEKDEERIAGLKK